MATPTTLFFDGQCGICHRFIRWLDSQDTTESIHCLSQQEAAQNPAYAAIDFRADAQGQPAELVLQAASGELLRDTDAYLRLLSLIKNTQPLAKALNTKAARPFVRRAAHAVVNNRQTLSKLFGVKPEPVSDLKKLEALPEPPRCAAPDQGD